MKTLLVVLAVAGMVASAHGALLVYGFDDENLDGWYMRTNEGSVPPEQVPVMGTNAPSQGEGFIATGIQSNNYYTLIRAPIGFQYDVTWEDYDTLSFDVRLSHPEGWNSMALLCRSDLEWSHVVGARQIYGYQSGMWVTISGPITPELTNLLYGSAWCFFEMVINQAETNVTEIDIDNLRLSSEDDVLTNGLALYSFDDASLDGWASYRRGVVSWSQTNTALGPGAMQIDVTNAVGNWANCARRSNALEDGPWAKNSNVLAWIRADMTWSNDLAPQLLLGMPGTNIRIYANENGGHVLLDDEWHPYTYTYDPAALAGAGSLDLTWEVTCAGTPAGKAFYVDNMRLLPGIGENPETNLLHAGLGVYDFETNQLDGWSGTSRSMAVWQTNSPALGIGAMDLHVTNGIGNWANAGIRIAAGGDAPWDENSNIVVWLKASTDTWHTSLSPQLTLTFDQTNVTLWPLGGGDALLDGEWHPYQYIYDRTLFDGSATLNLSLDVAVEGGDSPAGGVLSVDDIRLLPGIPEPALLCVGLAGLALIGHRRSR